MTSVDVTVYGAGAFGLAVGYGCARQGAKVRVIDPFGVGTGSSGGTVGALAPHVPDQWNPKKAFQFDSLDMAEEFWSEVAKVGGLESGYMRSGRIQPLADEAAVNLARKRALNAKELWQGKYQWNVVPVSDVEEWSPDSPSGWVVHDTLTARAAPRLATAALAAAITAKGGEIVREGEPEGKVVWATGWRGLVELSEQIGKTIGNGMKGQSAVLRYDAKNRPQIYANGVHIVPHADGTVAIGSTSEREFDTPDGVDTQLEEVIAKAKLAMPELADAEVIDRWAGVRPRAKSRAPMLGEHPLRPGEFIANGGFKIGFGMAPKIGFVMADLVLNGRDDIPDGFRVSDNM